eukprot:TRINITY_DN9029_c0_g1_i1.p1 TRINITY_DN9029_c0_g1~~TRINITY_DN9029_c0_g1_i1.p1  ORF type:complete len:392 (-),score=84.14 TRINITY_DN9029_c0_g1_i1:58-1233(-)
MYTTSWFVVLATLVLVSYGQTGLTVQPSTSGHWCFRANLSPSNEVPPATLPLGVNPTGMADVTLAGKPGNWSVLVGVRYMGLTGAPVSAHLHGPALAGSTGAVLKTLSPSGGTSGWIWNKWTMTDNEPLTDKSVGYLVSRSVYVNIHTTANPAGELRGNLYRVPCTCFEATPTGREADPPNNSVGTSSFYGILSGGLDQWIFKYHLTFNVPNAVTVAHIHAPAPAGGSAGVAHNFDGVAGKTSYDMFGWWSTGESTPQPLNNSFANYLSEGLSYVNIHTAPFPAGEVRGQIREVPCVQDEYPSCAEWNSCMACGVVPGCLWCEGSNSWSNDDSSSSYGWCMPQVDSTVVATCAKHGGYITSKCPTPSVRRPKHVHVSHRNDDRDDDSDRDD